MCMYTSQLVSIKSVEYVCITFILYVHYSINLNNAIAGYNYQNKSTAEFFHLPADKHAVKLKHLHQGGEPDHVMCCKNVLCCTQHKTSPIRVNGRQQKIFTFLTKFISFS